MLKRPGKGISSYGKLYFFCLQNMLRFLKVTHLSIGRYGAVPSTARDCCHRHKSAGVSAGTPVPYDGPGAPSCTVFTARSDTRTGATTAGTVDHVDKI